MSYQLEADEKLSDGIKRIIIEQADDAIAHLRGKEDVPRDEAVHEARKDFKKIRGALRLVRDEIGSKVYQRENTTYRDAGRRLAAVRESNVMIETIELLYEDFIPRFDPVTYKRVRQAFIEEHERIVAQLLDEEDRMTEVADTIEQAKQRIADLPIKHEEFSAIEDGLKRVYKRGYKGFKKAYKKPSGERFHEWRKRVKYLWYHTRILESVWPNLMDELGGSIHDLSDYLGDEHDLYDLQGRIQQLDVINNKEKGLIMEIIETRRNLLQRQAYPLAERIYTDKPKDFISRIENYWDAWRTEVTRL